jgi:DNA-binding CsgD family transcriptional regulator
MEQPRNAPATTMIVLVLAGDTDAVHDLVTELGLRAGGAGRPRSRGGSRRVDWGLLSERELQIAGLVGQALTNQQIAGRVNRSPHTVNYHLRQIFRKLDLTSRVELASLMRPDGCGHAPASTSARP